MSHASESPSKVRTFKRGNRLLMWTVLVACMSLVRAGRAQFRGTIRTSNQSRRPSSSGQVEVGNDDSIQSSFSLLSSDDNLEPWRRQLMEDRVTDNPTELPSRFPTVLLSGPPTTNSSPSAGPASMPSTALPTSEPSTTAAGPLPPMALPTSEPSISPATPLPSQDEGAAHVQSGNSSSSPTVSTTGNGTDETTGDVSVETNRRTLLPFSIVVVGSFSEGSVVRSQVQDYLMTYLQGPPYNMRAVQSVLLDEVVRAGEKANGNNGQRRIRAKTEQQEPEQDQTMQGLGGTSRMLNENNDLVDAAAAAAGTSLPTTILLFHGLVNLRDENMDGGNFFATKPTMGQIQEAQIEALEDTQALQDYFTTNFVSAQEEAEHGDDNREELSPVVLLQVQVDDRPWLELDPTEALRMINGTNSNLESTSNNSDTNDNNGSSWIVGLVIGIVLIAVAIMTSLFLVWRRKHERGKDALEIISDVDSDDNLDVIAYDKTTLNVSATKSTESGGGWIGKDDGMDGRSTKTGNTGRKGRRVFLLFGTKENKKNSFPAGFPSQERDEGRSAGSAMVAGFKNRGASRSPDSPKIVDDAAVGKGEGMVIVRTFSSLGKTSPTVIDLTTSATHSKGIERVEEEVPGIMALPPNGFSQNPPPFAHYKSRSTNQNIASQRDFDELDAVVAGKDIFSAASYDEESMMGYSLGSSHGPEISNSNMNSIMKRFPSAVATEIVRTTAADGNVEEALEFREGAKNGIRSHEDETNTDGDNMNLPNENENIRTEKAVSDSSSEESDTPQNPLFAGVQNLLNSSVDMDQPHKRRHPSKGKKRWYDQLRLGKKQRPQDFWSSDSESNRSLGTDPGFVQAVGSPPGKPHASTPGKNDDDHPNTVGYSNDHSFVDGEESEPVFILNTPESEDEAPSSYKEGDSFKGSGSSVMSGYSSAQISDTDPIYTIKTTNTTGSTNLSTLGYFRRKLRDDDGDFGSSDLHLMAEIAPAPSEEMDAVNIATSPAAPAIVSGDDVSDAPSDERHPAVSWSALYQSPLSSYDSNANDVQLVATTVDTDPAVVEYLMKERRNMKQRTRRKRADRKQPPVTMEV